MYHIYVVQLDDKCWDNEPRMRERNPHIDGRPNKCYYVGTSSDPAKRMREHLQGEARSNRMVEMYTVAVDHHYARCKDWDESVQLERSVAQELREGKNAVWCGN